MTELAESFRSLFERIGDILEIFDLSFFISGVSCFGAFLVWLIIYGCKFSSIFDSGYKIIGIVVACYILGLLCFSVGRWIRRSIRKISSDNDFKNDFIQAVKSNKLEEVPILKDHYNSNNDIMAFRSLYARLWTEVRQDDSLSPSLSLLNKYWILSATYDGISMSIIIWFISVLLWTLGIGSPAKLNVYLGFTVLVFLIVIYFSCIRESKRLERYQLGDLLTVIAYKSSRNN